MKCGRDPKLDVGGWLNKTCSWRDWFSVIAHRVIQTHLMDSNRLPLRTICHNMGSQCSQWELCTHVCKGKKKFSTLPPWLKQTGRLLRGNIFSHWCFCEGGTAGTGREETCCTLTCLGCCSFIWAQQPWWARRWRRSRRRYVGKKTAGEKEHCG